MDNVALQKIMVNKATAFGVTVDVSLLVVNLEANMEYTQSHKWGCEFRISGQAIHKKYPDYSHNHNQSCMTTCSKNTRWSTRCRYYVKHQLPTTNRQIRSEHSVDNLRLSNVPLTTTKRALSQWMRIPAGAQRKQAQKRRKIARADTDVTGTMRAGAANTTANCMDAACRQNDG